MKKFILIASLLAACAAPQTTPTGQESELQRLSLEHGPPAAGDRGVPVVTAPGDDELGDYYVIRGRGARWAIGRTHVLIGRDGAADREVTVEECAASKTVRTLHWDGIGPEPPDDAQHRVTPMVEDVPAPVVDAEWVAVEMSGPGSARTCLRGARLAEPLQEGSEFWCRRTEGVWSCADMAVGGGSPQCSGPCEWFQRVAQ